MTKKPADPAAALAELEAHATNIRRALKASRQGEVFRVAVEAGYLTAMADGEVDGAEHATIVRVIEILSEGAVIEWETESLLADCAKRAKRDGAAKRAEATGKELADLRQAEVGILFAALVAGASKGIDKKEADVLKAVGAAAGVGGDVVRGIVKRANAMRQAG